VRQSAIRLRWSSAKRRFGRSAVQVNLGSRARAIALSQPTILLRGIRCCCVLVGSQESEGSPMHAYAWYVWRKKPRTGPSLKVRIGKHELVGVLGDESRGALPLQRSRPKAVEYGRRKIELRAQLASCTDTVGA
jgi:hypothetical protein